VFAINYLLVSYSFYQKLQKQIKIYYLLRRYIAIITPAKTSAIIAIIPVGCVHQGAEGTGGVGT
jgi:hypothetical protein